MYHSLSSRYLYYNRNYRKSLELISVSLDNGIAFMIFVNCRVYWYNGVTYEDAVAAGAERCKVYAFRHFIRFGIFAVAYVAFSAIMQVLKVGMWVDIVIFSIGLIAVAISTVKIKL